MKNFEQRDFPDGTVVNMSHCRAGSAGSIPGQGTKILPHSTACGQKVKEKKTNKNAEIIFHTDDLDSTATKNSFEQEKQAKKSIQLTN